MFKSIEYNLLISLLLLMLSLVGATVLFMQGEVFYGVLCSLVGVTSLVLLFWNHRKYNKNILFLLNAMENDDYTFHFSVNHLTRRERELNRMLNRIKSLLVKARREIIENENFLGVIVESVSTGIIILDQDGFVRNVNQAANFLLGVDDLSHLNQLQNVDKSFPALFRNLKAGDNPLIKRTNEREEVQLSLRVTEILASGAPLRVITISNIGGELQANEMESWIRLIRVMTHEIMNSIAPITSVSESLLFSFRSHKEEIANPSLYANTVDALETVNTTAKGLLRFIQSYRRFTHLPPIQPAFFELKPLLEKVLMLEANDCEQKHISISIQPNSEGVQLYADENQVFQLLVNLVKNAIEAIDGQEEACTGGRKIELVVSASSARTIVEVRNNGAPIPNDILPHIFVPFFTTKEEGSGIGLSLSRYIMRLHEGNLNHYTDREWTVFRLVFPKREEVSV